MKLQKIENGRLILYLQKRDLEILRSIDEFTLAELFNEESIVNDKCSKDGYYKITNPDNIKYIRGLSFIPDYSTLCTKNAIELNTLEMKAKDKPISVEDQIIKKATFEELQRAINSLPETQRRRIKKYYFAEKNEYEIAKEEHTTQQAVNKSLRLAIQKLKEILKK